MASKAIATPDPDRAEEPTSCRDFALSDAMILVAGIALFLSISSYRFAYLAEASIRLCRKVAENRSDLLEHWPVFWIRIRDSLVSSVSHFDEMLRDLFVCMMFPFLALRWKRPRPPAYAILRQPGTVAVMAALFGGFWIVGLLNYVFYATIDPRLAGSLGVGGAVTIAWAILALSRRWQGEPGWIDRIGRWLGVAAILHLMLGILLYLVIPRFW